MLKMRKNKYREELPGKSVYKELVHDSWGFRGIITSGSESSYAGITRVGAYSTCIWQPIENADTEV